MPKREPVPPGCVVISIADLAALIAAARPPDTGQAVRAAPPSPSPGGTALPALRAAIAMLTSRIGGAEVDDRDLIGDIPSAAVIAALAAIAVRALECGFPDVATITVLRDLAMAAALSA